MTHRRARGDKLEIALEGISARDRQPGSNGLTLGHGIGIGRDRYRHAKPLRQHVRAILSQRLVFDSDASFPMPLFERRAVSGWQSSRVQLRIPKEQVAEARDHKDALPVNLATIEATFLNPALKFRPR